MYGQLESSCSGPEADRESNSDGELNNVWGNVRKLLVLPPDYKGEAVKGHLVFDAAFESGNLGRVDYVSECEYDLFIRPDTNSPRHRVWFYFSVENVRAEQKVVFNVINFSKTRSLFRDGMAPVVKSSSRPRWQRIPPRHAHYDRSAAHNDQYVISFAFAFDRDDDVYYFAYCFPYTYTRLQRHLSSLEDRRLPYFQREILAQGRWLDLITITDPTNLESSEVQRVVFITSRVHSGESPASYVCQGLIDFLASDNPVAVVLRRNFLFKIIPMLNPDGVYVGNGRCSSLGSDLNRSWERPSEASHPTIHATKKLLIQYEQDPRMQVDFFIDLHSHSQQLNAFLYGNVFSNDPILSERQAILPTLLSEIAVSYSLDLTQFNRDPVKAGTGRRVVATVLDGKPMCYTLEVSVFGYVRKEQSSDIIPYTEESYQKLGEDLARAFHQYLEVERGVRAVQVRPFHLFLPNASSTAVNETTNTTPKQSLVISGIKASTTSTECKKPTQRANAYLVRKISNPGTASKLDKEPVCGRNSYSVFQQQPNGIVMDEV